MSLAEDRDALASWIEVSSYTGAEISEFTIHNHIEYARRPSECSASAYFLTLKSLTHKLNIYCQGPHLVTTDDVGTSNMKRDSMRPEATMRRKMNSRRGIVLALLGCTLLEVVYGCAGDASTETFVEENVGDITEAINDADQPPPPSCGGLYQACCADGTCGSSGLDCVSGYCYQVSYSANPFYAVGSGIGDNSSDVYRFNYNNGLIQNFVKLGEAGRILLDVAIDDYAYTGTIYAVDSNSYLVKVSPTNGSSQTIGYLGYAVNALDFCTYLGTGLYGWTTSGALVRINTANGTAALVGYASHTSSGDLACSGKLYGTALVSGSWDRLVEINAQSGASTAIGTTGVSGMYGLEIDGGGVMFAARATSTQLELYVVNRTTGWATLRATYGTNSGLYGLTTLSPAL